jgi:hypothetical protein
MVIDDETGELEGRDQCLAALKGDIRRLAGPQERLGLRN